MTANDYQIGGDHYHRLSIQPWDALQSWLTHDQYVGFLLGNALVYLARFNAMEQGKGGVQDVRKAVHTLEKLLETLSDDRCVARSTDGVGTGDSPGGLRPDYAGIAFRSTDMN